MTEDELKAIDLRLADMSARCDAVIAKESRGKPMPVLDFKPRRRPKAKYVPDYDREISDEALRSATMKFDHTLEQAAEGSIEQIFAEFERQFDEMAQAHRGRA